jgi:hypothetical protein
LVASLLAVEPVVPPILPGPTMTLKLSRLIQPRNPLFWLMLVLNALSSAFTYVLHTYELTTPAMLVVGGFALANAIIGMGLVLRLLRGEPSMSPGSPESG